MRRVTFLEMYQWFATTLVYYGLSFGAGNLAGSILMNNFYNGLLEFTSYLILPYLIDWKRIGRKYGTVVTMSIGAIGCIGAGIFVIEFKIYQKKLISRLVLSEFFENYLWLFESMKKS